MRPRLVTCVITCLTCLVVAAGCAQPTYDVSRLRRQLEDAGVPADQARCVTDAMENTVDQNELGARADVTAQAVATTRTLLERCGVNLGQPTR